MENHSTDEVSRLLINVEKLTQEVKLRNATNHKSMYDDTTNINKTVNSSNGPIARLRIYSTGLKKN